MVLLEVINVKNLRRIFFMLFYFSTVFFTGCKSENEENPIEQWDVYETLKNKQLWLQEILNTKQLHHILL
jgi:hypothetical protein